MANIEFQTTPDVRVDRAARFHATFAAPCLIRDPLPPLASDELFDCVLGTPTIQNNRAGSPQTSPTRFVEQRQCPNPRRTLGSSREPKSLRRFLLSGAASFLLGAAAFRKLYSLSWAE